MGGKKHATHCTSLLSRSTGSLAWGSGAALRAHGQREMAARAAAGDAETVRVHALFGRVVPDEPYRAVDVRLDFRDGDTSAASRAPPRRPCSRAANSGSKYSGMMRRGGEPAAADHEDDADAVGLARLENVDVSAVPNLRP